MAYGSGVAWKSGTVRRLLAGAALAALASAGAGCDTAAGRADRDVLDTLAATPPAMNAEQAAKNVSIYTNLAKNDAISTPRRALAKAALADAELQAAQYAEADLQAQEALISRKLWEIDQISAQASQIAAMLQAIQMTDPNKPLATPVGGQTTVVAALKANAAAARGEGTTPWAGNDAAPLSSVSAVRQTISSLTGKVTEAKSNVDSLTQKRQALLSDAAKAEQASEAATGDVSEKQFMQAADLRKQAALLAVQIEQGNASIVPLQQDLDAAHAHEAIVTAAADSFDATSKNYADQFDDVNKQSASLKSLASSMVTGDKGSIKSQTAELNALVATAAQMHGKTVEAFKEAITYYNDAITSSEKVRTEGGKAADNSPVDQMLAKDRNDVHEGWGLRMRFADAGDGLGSTNAQWATLLASRQKLVATVTPALRPLGLDVPAGLADAKTDEDIKEARTAADEAYTAADSTLSDVSNSAPNKIKADAKLLRAALKVGWATLAADSGKAADAKTMLSDAQGYEKEVMDDPQGVSVPLSLMMLTDVSPPTTMPAK